MKKTAYVAALILVAAGLAWFFGFREKADGVQYKTEKASQKDITASVTATGTVNAVTTVLVGTQASGTIKNIYVDFNSHVKKGQVIAEIDPTTFEAQTDQAKANLLSAKASFSKAEVALSDARRTLQRNRELFAKGFISKSDLDASETAHDSAQAQVEASKAQVAQSEAALKYSATNLRYTKILSPVAGTVISRNVDVGQTVAASFQTPTLFTIAQDLTKMQIDTSVDEADIGKIREKQEAEFTVDAYPDMTFKGKVDQVRNSPVSVQNVVTYDVVIKVDNPDMKLKPGMTANVSIITSSKSAVMAVPNAAFRFRPSDRTAREQKGYGVWVMSGKASARIKVNPGITDGSFTEVLSGDIREGQEVIVEEIQKTKKNGNQSMPRMPR